MSDYMEQVKREEEEAARRVRLEKVETKKYSGLRSAYAVFIDSEERARLVCKAGWGARWKVEPFTGNQYDALLCFVHNKKHAPRAIIEAFKKHPDRFPMRAEIEAQEADAKRRYEAARQRVAENEAKRKADKAQALEGLASIRGSRELSNFERAALLTAIRLLEGSAQ